MLLFSRVVTLAGSPRRSVPWAVGITGYVNDHSDLDVTLWSSTFGSPLGTMAWSALVESQAALADGTSKLLVDDGYFDLLEEGRDLIAQPGEDHLREVVHGQPGDPPPIGAVATITTATAHVDAFTDAVGWAVEIAQYASGVMDVPVSVLTSVFGQIGEIAWISVQPDVASADASRIKLNSDDGYLGRMPAAKDLFVPASGHISQATRLA